MQRLSREEFLARFPLPAPSRKLRDMPPSASVVVDDDAVLDGLYRDVIVRNNARVEIRGLVERSLTVERGSVVRVTGLIDGRLYVDGAVLIDGHVAGRISGPANACIVDPTGPADSEIG